MRWLVIDAATGKPVAESNWINNLILTRGMNEVATRLWCNCFTHCSAGTDGSPSSDSSGSVTMVQSGANGTASAAFFTSAMVGDVIKWTSSGDERLITAFTDDQHVTLSPATPNANSGVAGTFTLWRTGRTGLVAESKRTGTYLTGSPNCETSRTGSILRHRRTFDFSVEVTNTTFSEIGLCWAISGANTHFSRIVPPPIPVLSGQFLRVVYELSLTLSPTLPSHVNPPIGGWPVSPATTNDGDEMLQYVGMSSIVSASGATSSFDNGGTTNEPSGFGSPNSMWVSSDSSALELFAQTPVSRTGQLGTSVVTAAPYTQNSFVQDKVGTFNVGQANSNSIRSIGIGSSTLSQIYRDTGWMILFDEGQTKPNTHVLEINVRYSWSRVLA